jgi:acetylornithine deacetylase/succinyl-diaminopimelate desuccinylase-like protein
LVSGQNPSKIKDAFRAFVRAHIPIGSSVEFKEHSASCAVTFDHNLPEIDGARTALGQEWKEALLVGSGASIPAVATFKQLLGINTLLIGFGLDDDCIHSPNEKYDLANFHKGARSWACILAALAAN